MSVRPTKTMYYLGIAEAVSRRSTCLKCRVGAVIVKDDIIISTGYNGAPRGKINCIDRGFCERVKRNMPHGTGYSICKSVHAEANAIINASRHEMLHSVMYLYSWDIVRSCVVSDVGCCQNCRRMVINAGIGQVIFADPNGIDAPLQYDPVGYGYTITDVESWVQADDDPPVST